MGVRSRYGTMTVTTVCTPATAPCSSEFEANLWPSKLEISSHPNRRKGTTHGILEGLYDRSIFRMATSNFREGVMFIPSRNRAENKQSRETNKERRNILGIISELRTISGSFRNFDGWLLKGDPSLTNRIPFANEFERSYPANQ